jgi:hypothetical protein
MQGSINSMTKTVAISDQQIAEAMRRGVESDVTEARALAARYDRGSGQLLVALRGGARLLVPAQLLQGVAEAAPELIEEVEVDARGPGLHRETLDADVSLSGLVSGSFGSKRWMEDLAASGQLDTASQDRLHLLEWLTSRAQGSPAAAGA